MTFDLFIPYIAGASLDLNDNLNDYYKTPKDYADALINEDVSNGSSVYNAMIRGGIHNTVGYNSFGRDMSKINEKILYAKAECQLFSPNGFSPETVDSMIDKFASQCEFIVTAHFDTKEMDLEFEEELRMWSKETINILRFGKEMVHLGYSNNDSEIFVERNIPRRDLRISFLNKSGKRVDFVLKGCEIEQKLAKNRYLFYVKNMQMLR